MSKVDGLAAVRSHIEGKADEGKSEARRVSGVDFAARGTGGQS
jgi:hypothetical protein